VEGRLAQTVVDELRRCVGRRGDLLIDTILGWLQIFSAAPVAQPRNCICFHTALYERRIEWDSKPEIC